MKKTCVFITILIIFSSCFAFSKFTNDKNLDIVSGYIKVYGNDPFPFLRIETDENTKYTLKADKNILDKIQNTQGHKIQIRGKIENNKLIVYDWKYAE